MSLNKKRFPYYSLTFGILSLIVPSIFSITSLLFVNFFNRPLFPIPFGTYIFIIIYSYMIVISLFSGIIFLVAKDKEIKKLIYSVVGIGASILSIFKFGPIIYEFFVNGINSFPL